MTNITSSKRNQTRRNPRTAEGKMDIWSRKQAGSTRLGDRRGCMKREQRGQIAADLSEYIQDSLDLLADKAYHAYMLELEEAAWYVASDLYWMEERRREDLHNSEMDWEQANYCGMHERQYGNGRDAIENEIEWMLNDRIEARLERMAIASGFYGW